MLQNSSHPLTNKLNNMKKLLFVLLGFTSMITLKAQSDKIDDFTTSGSGTTSKSIYGEFIGGGLIFSANFDSRFSGAKNFGYRAGIGLFPASGQAIITVPVGLNYLIGNAPSYFEIEATGTFVSTKAKTGSFKTTSIFFWPHIGYRYTKSSNSIFFKIDAGPLILTNKVFPWGGLGVGYTLK